MTWFEDDSHKIPDSIKKMPPDEVEKIAAAYEEQLRRESAKLKKGSLSA
jgi:hypothetical protein